MRLASGVGRAVLLVALAFAIEPLPAAHAIGPVEVFSVSVPVDATAASAAQARDTARADGQRRAFRQLLERLTPAAEWRRLPRVDDATLTNMVIDFEVANERSSAVRYLADYTFRFRPDEVRRLLRDNAIPFAETPSKPVVVLPVLIAGEKPVLWEAPSAWRTAWNSVKSDGLVPLAVPPGDPGDRAAIDAPQALAAAPDALAAIAQKYGADDAVVASATLRGDGEARALELGAKRFGAGQPGTVASGTYRATPGESEADFLVRVAGVVAREIEEAWKKETVLRFGEEGHLLVAVPVNALADWVAVRERLAGVAAIRRVDILSLSGELVSLELHFVGDPSQLRLALAQRDLVLTAGEPQWTLRRRGGAPAPRR
jgi:hypothetical protein